jgi:succinylglutamic semialdehyde dehydrogenase
MTSHFNFSDLGAYIINGSEASPSVNNTRASIESLNPFSGQLLWRGEESARHTIDDAVDAARTAFKKWSSMSPAERQAILARFGSLVRERAELLTHIIAIEAGKPLWESRIEVNSLVTKVDASIDAYKSRASDSAREVRGLCSKTSFVPHGVMAVLGPFNFPASMANGHIMPALLAGNTVVFKPSELTPVVGLVVSRLWQEAGLPPGVLNCVTGGKDTAEYLVAHKDVAGVLFVGSHAAGMSILRALADSPEKIVAVEMGGNSPLVIWDYENLDAAIHVIIQSSFISAGQRCSAARRLFVRKEDRQLIPRLKAVLSSLRIGDFNQTPEPYYGPVIRTTAADKILCRVGELISAGADPILLPQRNGPIGTVITPGLLGVDDCSDDRDEEIFGPILKVYRYSSIDEAITLANNTQFGLAAGIVCRERSVFDKFFHEVKAGIINWNQQLTGATTLAPFGGVKHSGNFRPAGFLSVDYCSYAVASFEVEKPKLPDVPTPGITF